MKGKILLITGKKGEGRLEEILSGVKFPWKIHVSKVDVAAFLTPEIILKELSRENLSEVKKVIVPGTMRGDVNIISKELEVQVIKGPSNLEELKRFLGRNEKILEPFSQAKNFLLKIGKSSPVFLSERISRVMAEIIDAPKLSSQELEGIAKYYVNSGAGIIDIGMISGEDNSEKIPEIIRAIRKKVKAPISIDTLNEKEISVGMDNGIDLVLSLDFSNYKIAKKIDFPAVIIPRREGKVPSRAERRITLIEKLMKKLKREKFNKIIIDPILSPVNFGFLESLQAYSQLREKYPRIPMMMGVGNITELMDVDSIGINGLLAGIASELGVNLLLTTEASAKTRGGVRELFTATKMMQLAKLQQSNPKDFGGDLNLLRLKEKRVKGIMPIDKKIKTIKVKKRKLNLEKGGWFKIYVDNEKIKVIYCRDKTLQRQFEGASGEVIYQEIIARGLIKNLSHAAYLGSELEKAEIALKLGRGYRQDEDLF